MNHSPPPTAAIRTPETVSQRFCGMCQQPLLVAGPTGFLGDKPVCDICMLEHNEPLGMALVLMAVARAYGAAYPESTSEEDRSRVELMAFVRLYQSHAARSGPSRPIPSPSPKAAQPDE